ncbi:unnamed protein product [Phaedon cochleariae]|uniref:Tetraspanin n=1 Tax=Phaedon cochleariae TaxID=80249 RepID=A0A9N9SJ22_PHACE|nr:unnamed protein product [Phaedon cochleariae]CAG9822026.1 unnamed protein product [Phaedon cochleariae]
MMGIINDFGNLLRKRYMRMKFAPNENVLRVALLVFSICFGILSISLTALGVAYTHELKWPKPYIGLDFMELPTWVIILGVVSLVLSFVGCFCAKCYNRTIYFLFGVFLCLVLCLEMTIAIVAFQNKSESKRLKTQTLMEAHKINGTVLFKAIEEHVSF